MARLSARRAAVLLLAAALSACAHQAPRRGAEGPTCASIVYHPESSPGQGSKQLRLDLCRRLGFLYLGVKPSGAAPDGRPDSYDWFGECRAYPGEVVSGAVVSLKTCRAYVPGPEDAFEPADEKAAAAEFQGKLERANALFARREYEDSAAAAADAAAFAEARFGKNDLRAARALSAQATADSLLGRYDEADPLFRRALAIAKRADPPQPGIDVYRDAADYLAGSYELRRDPARAEAVWADLEQYLGKLLDPSDTELRDVRRNLADMYLRHGKPELARPLSLKAAAAEGPSSSDVEGCPAAGTASLGFSMAAGLGDCARPGSIVAANLQPLRDDCGRRFPGSGAANVKVAECRAGSAGVTGTLSAECRLCPARR